MSPDSISSNLIEVLQKQGQEHLLQHLQSLPTDTQTKLAARLDKINWQELRQIYKAPDLSVVEPTQVISLSDRQKFASEYIALGEAGYAAGEVAVLLVAGGEGSRLGFEGPKGCFPIGPVSRDSLYQKHAEKVLAISRWTGHSVPFILMTSPSTHEASVEFFNDKNLFGLSPTQFHIFQQETVPTTDLHGKVLLKRPGQILENPNGHGGSIDGLMSSGILNTLGRNGIKDIVYIQIDNVLAPTYDPFAVGLRRARNADLVNKVIRKTSPEEKVGALVKVHGIDSIIEYSDLTDAQKLLTNPDGSYLFGWGNVAAHVVSVDFLQRLQREHFTLPFHQAMKEVDAWSGEGTATMRTKAIKHERFFFDILAKAKNIGLEIRRSEEFAPLKNREGADSISSARALISEEHGRWLRECGISVSNEALVEIRPTFASTIDELRQQCSKNSSLQELREVHDKILL